MLTVLGIIAIWYGIGLIGAALALLSDTYYFKIFITRGDIIDVMAWAVLGPVFLLFIILLVLHEMDWFDGLRDRWDEFRDKVVYDPNEKD